MGEIWRLNKRIALWISTITHFDDLKPRRQRKIILCGVAVSISWT
jgi:hypothetical protein